MSNKEKKQILEIFETIGLKPGDIVLVHSDFTAIKELSHLKWGEALDLLKECFLEIIGETGTLITPIFNWDFCKGKPFHQKATRSQAGMLTDRILFDERSIRSGHPIYSFVAIGPSSEDIFSDISKSSFGINSVFHKLHRLNAKILFFNVGFESCTFIHYVEQSIGVNYRFLKEFSGMVTMDEKTYFDTVDFYVRDLQKNVTSSLKKLSTYLQTSGKMKTGLIQNKYPVLITTCDDIYAATVENSKDSPCYLLKQPPLELPKSDTDKQTIFRNEYDLLKKLFPICRSITGDGVRRTLKILSEIIPLNTYEVPTGTKVFDWNIPKEWNIRDAFIADESNNKIVDFHQNNLHIVGYSIPVNKWISLSELQEHLYSIPEQPNAIPYVTSYYKELWGFCISDKKRKALKEGKYHVSIDSKLEDGYLTYGEYILKGQTEQEIFISTNICHPSMANNELSGPVIAAFLAKWLASRKRRYTYRIIFIPETIGSITYLSKNIDILKNNMLAGFNLTCIGDDRAYSYVASRYEKTYADKVVQNVMSSKYPGFIKYSFIARGSDERQYSSPGVDLPLVTLCRSKFCEYPEYHTSLDNLNLVTPTGLKGGLQLVKDCINVIENNYVYQIKCYGEPQLGKRNLYPSLSTKKTRAQVQTMMDFISYADGKNDIIDISNHISKPVDELFIIAEKLFKVGLLDRVSDKFQTDGINALHRSKIL